jgi:hypothetical protein
MSHRVTGLQRISRRDSALYCHPTNIRHGFKRRTTMLSARNQFKGKVKRVKLGNIMAEVVVTVGKLEIVAAITRGSAESLRL